MTLRPVKLLPAAVAAGVVLAACALVSFPALPGAGFFERLEWITYDGRVRIAAAYPKPAVTNLAAVFIDDTSLRVVNEGLQFSWPWPRELHGLLARRLAEAGAKRVAFDILFAELHADTNSDAAFARDLRSTGNVYLAAFGETLAHQWHAVPPAPLFRTNALAVGHATSDRDADGVLRRAKPFQDDPKLGRLWHLGILLAAADLELDLDGAEVSARQIVLRGPRSIKRIIPLDPEGYFFIDWSLAWNDARLTKSRFEEVVARPPADSAPPATSFTGKLVVVGSIGAGNNISDVGATPVSKETYLVSKHWNVANSMITGTFIRRTSTATTVLIIVALGTLSALFTWKFAAGRASSLVVLVGIAYSGIALWLYAQYRLWLPMALPVVGGLVVTHVATVTYRLVFEEREGRRVRSIFSRLVSPDVVTELLAAEDLHLGGARRRITVFFADVRGFTEMTDSAQAKAEEYIRQHQLSPDQAETFLDEDARETLETVNTYLSLIADQIKKHGGTLDKYIGDCVMAFWGAPARIEQHALCCVRAAIDAQRAIHELNQRRQAENKRREAENAQRAASGQPPRRLLPVLQLGTGINTGTAVVGLMGSDAHILNYTVFGREVNLASRLEGHSGRGRIYISEATYKELLRDAPELAATCAKIAPAQLKGFGTAVNIYEVPWKDSVTPEAAPATGAATAVPATTPAASGSSAPVAGE